MNAPPHLVQQVVRGGYFVPEGDGGRAVGGVGRYNTVGQYLVQRVGQH